MKHLILFLLLVCNLTASESYEFEETPLEVALEEARFVDRMNHRTSGDIPRFFKRFVFQVNGHCRNSGQNVEHSKEVHKTLVAHQKRGIRFNREKLVPFDERGTCSAMALDFAARYNSVCSKISDPLKRLDCLKKLAPHYACYSSVFKSRQAAYNTIEVRSFTFWSTLLNPELSEELKERRIASLGNYHALNLVPIMPSVRTDDIGIEWDLKHTVNSLEEGTYVVRMISSGFTNKHEHYGHTMVFVKNKDLDLYFDNSEGLMNVTGNLEDAVQETLLDWGIPEFRIYRASCPADGCINFFN